ncbi:MAG TPA: hypothetical protein VLL52_07810 [Anaerolineae bacterium]|nr:hypothetical protein [Anaerolineae bacterium]
MEAVYIFFIKYDVPIGIVATLTAAWYITEFFRARASLKTAIFTLEREKSQAAFNRSLLFLLVCFGLLGLIYYVNTNIAPTIPEDRLYAPTPTANPFITPFASPTLPGTSTPTLPPPLPRSSPPSPSPVSIRSLPPNPPPPPHHHPPSPSPPVATSATSPNLSPMRKLPARSLSSAKPKPQPITLVAIFLKLMVPKPMVTGSPSSANPSANPLLPACSAPLIYAHGKTAVIASASPLLTPKIPPSASAPSPSRSLTLNPPPAVPPIRLIPLLALADPPPDSIAIK